MLRAILCSVVVSVVSGGTRDHEDGIGFSYIKASVLSSVLSCPSKKKNGGLEP